MVSDGGTGGRGVVVGRLISSSFSCVGELSGSDCFNGSGSEGGVSIRIICFLGDLRGEVKPRWRPGVLEVEEVVGGLLGGVVDLGSGIVRGSSFG